MKPRRQVLRRVLGAAFAATAFTAFVSTPSAQELPASVRIVVPFPPGGTTDILARQLAAQLQQRWNRTVLVENRAGASGTIFSEQLARMPADGATLLLTATHHVINPGLYKALKYDTRADFTPLAQVAVVPNVLVVHPSFAPRTVQELVAYAKANPGKVSFGSAGAGGANHLSGELFKSLAGVDMVHVPYKGAAPALNDLLGAQIPMMFDSVPGVIQHIQAGRLRALGVTSLKRSPALPEVPTIDEAGIRSFEALAWFGLYAPGRMPVALRDRIAGDVLQVLQSPAIRAQFQQQGAEPGALTQSQFATFVDAELVKWGKVIADARVTLE